MELPSHCYDCGAYLMGGATRHKRKCSILKMIKQAAGKGKKKK